MHVTRCATNLAVGVGGIGAGAFFALNGNQGTLFWQLRLEALLRWLFGLAHVWVPVRLVTRSGSGYCLRTLRLQVRAP